MPRKTTRDFEPEALRLFDRYVHGELDRRGFLQAAAGLAAGAAGAAGLLASLAPSFAQARQVEPDDPGLVISRPRFASEQGYGEAGGYLVQPAADTGKLPAVLVIHENRGLNPHIEDVARRLAKAGYLAFAPDALLPIGGYPGDEDAARMHFQILDQAKTRQDMLAAARWLQGHEQGNGCLGVVGFCYGGAIANFLATQLPDLKAAAPFYGGAPELADVPAIRAELLVVLAADDARVNASWPGYQVALEAADVRYTLLQPGGTVHGFHNDTTPRYDEPSAKLAWDATLDLFERRLKA